MLLLSCFTCSSSSREPVTFPQAKQGILDLSAWDFKINGNIQLSGEFEFYWQELLTPADFKGKRTGKPLYLKVPGAWKIQDIEHDLKKGRGYGTYRVHIKLPEAGITYGLAIYQVTAYKLYINGQFVYEDGKVSKDFNEITHRRSNMVFSYTPQTKEMELVIQIANVIHNRTGLVRSLQIGYNKNILTSKFFINGYEFFLLGAILIIAIYHLMLFVFRSQEMAYLYFALLCLGTCMYLISMSSLAFFYFFPEVDLLILNKLAFFGSLLILTALSLYMAKIFEKEFIKKINIIIYAGSTLFSFLVIVLPTRIISQMEIALLIYAAAVTVYVSIAFVRSIIKRREGAYIFGLGTAGLITAIVFDLIHEFDLNPMHFHPIAFIPLGIFFFILSQSVLLSSRFSNAFKHTEKLASELKATNKVYSRFVPLDFLHFLKKESILNISLGDQIEMQMTILFSDIRSFTTMSEKMSVKETFSFINNYLSLMGPLIRQRHGFIDKYIGDAIMALFPGSEDAAVRAAVNMQKILKKDNLFGLKNQIKTGIGIHCGRLMLGIIGEEERMESTVIADTVNAAARLEKLTKVYGAEIIISDQVYNRLKSPHDFILRKLGHVQVKGKTELLYIREVCDGNQPDIASKKQQYVKEFDQGVECFYNKKYEEAAHWFNKVKTAANQDKVKQYYLNQLNLLLNKNTGKD